MSIYSTLTSVQYRLALNTCITVKSPKRSPALATSIVARSQSPVQLIAVALQDSSLNYEQANITPPLLSMKSPGFWLPFSNFFDLPETKHAGHSELLSSVTTQKYISHLIVF